MQIPAGLQVLHARSPKRKHESIKYQSVFVSPRSSSLRRIIAVLLSSPFHLFYDCFQKARMPIEVISLISDDESQPIPLLRKRIRANPAPTNIVSISDDESAPIPRLRKRIRANPAPTSIVSISDDESAPIPRLRKRLRTNPGSTNLVTPTEDEVVIVSHKKRGADDLTTAVHPTQTKAEDEIECVGEQRGVDVLADYPHFRFQCAKLVWPSMVCRGTKRQRFCPRCFCYVCDIPAAECQKWSSHEHAHDGTMAWRSKRIEKLEKRKRLARSNNPSQQICNPFMTPFRAQAGNVCNRQALPGNAARRRRKAKAKRSGPGKKRGRPR